jgi:hypothetical protein
MYKLTADLPTSNTYFLVAEPENSVLPKILSQLHEVHILNSCFK